MIENMAIKVLLFGLLCNVICKGFSQDDIIEIHPLFDEETTEISPTYDVVLDCARLLCASSINRKRGQMHQMNGFIEYHTELIKNSKLKPSEKHFLKTELEKVKNLTDDYTARINSDLDKICYAPDAEAPREWCMEEMKEHRTIFKNIILAAKQFKISIRNTGILDNYYQQLQANNIPQLYYRKS